MTRPLTTILLIILLSSCARSENPDNPQLVGAREGCEAIFEYGDRKLTSVDTLPDFNERDGVNIKEKSAF